METYLTIFWLTLRVGLFSTTLCLPFAILIGYALARHRVPLPSLIRAMISLPMVMPPVAVGLALLWFFGTKSPLAPLWQWLGVEMIFTPSAAVIAAAVVGFPLLARSAEQSFAAIDSSYEEMARTLGASPVATFFRVSLPLARRGLLYGSLLCFARALGEFGATAVIAGIIPERTETLSLGIWSRIQLGDDQGAGILVGLSFILALASMLVAERWLRPGPK
ncbi:MAG TPA: molybdate ABC transporter permease subunit [Myxococcales bacterium]|nr:molybdate ABC transporter permease subunit [Myxococcales bacterium]HIK83482.1 molybdate ABC transporter permease subunit [Myxococcales bacterium]